MERVIDADERISPGTAPTVRGTPSRSTTFITNTICARARSRQASSGRQRGNPHGWAPCEVADRPAATQRSDHRREAILDALDRWLHESSLEAINIAEISSLGGRHAVGVLLLLREQGRCRGGAMERMVDETFAVSARAHPRRPTRRANASTPCSTACSVRANTAPPHVQGDARRAGSSASVRDIWDNARESFVESVAEMIRTDRAAGRARWGGRRGHGISPARVQRSLARTSHAGRHVDPATAGDGAAAVWLSSIYGINETVHRSEETA
jgi:hypothetical protein